MIGWLVLCFRKRIGGDPFGGFDESGPKDGAQRLQNILHVVSSNGEHEKLTQVTEETLNMTSTCEEFGLIR